MEKRVNNTVESRDVVLAGGATVVSLVIREVTYETFVRVVVDLLSHEVSDGSAVSVMDMV